MEGDQRPGGSIRPDEVIPPQSGGSIQVRQMAKDAALMLPNLVKLLSRLVKDPRVPRRSKLVLLAAVGYVISPIDILPEMIPVAGILDDLFLVAFALNHLIERAGEELVVEHWDGPQDILEMVRSALGTINDFVPQKIRKLLGRLAGG
ncbi:MAG TPA: YkvA family protein [Acidimicrobiia bacterium]|jgi:uncharacterized membrane protein YkvA (DUF1232 family)